MGRGEAIMLNKFQIRKLGQIVSALLFLGYAGVAKAADTEVNTGNNKTVATGAGNRIVANANTSYVITPGTVADQNGIIAALKGADISFAAGSTVDITNGSGYRSLYIGNNNGGTGNFAGTIIVTSSNNASRDIHFDNGATANFLADSTTTVTSTGNNNYGFAMSNGATSNVRGTFSVTTAGTGAYVKPDGTISTGGSSATTLMVGWQNNNNGGTLNVLGTGSVTAKAKGNMITAGVDKLASISTELGTTLDLEGSYANQTTLWVRAGQVKTLGNVTISAIGNNSQALYMAEVGTTGVTANYGEIVDINGISDSQNMKKINITGDLYNYSYRDIDYLSIKMGGTDSFFIGDNHLEGKGRSSTFEFSGSSKWTGDNIVNTTNATGAVTAGFRDTAEFVGDNTVTSGEGNMSFNNNSKWTGNNTVNGANGQATVSMSGSSNWEGNNSVSNGKAFVYLDETSTWAGDNESSGGDTHVYGGNNGDSTAVWKGNNTISGGYFTGTFMQDTKIELDQNTVTSGTGQIHLYNNATLSKDGNTDFTTNTVSGGGMSFNAHNQSKVYVNNNVTGGGTTLSLEDSAYGKGTNVISGTGRLEGYFIGAAQYEGDTTVSENGSVQISASNTATWNGDNTINGGSMMSTLLGDAKYTGNTNITAGTNEATAYNNATFDSDVTISGGTDKITIEGDATGTAKWVGSNTATGGTTDVYLNNKSLWTGNNNVSGGTNDVVLTGSGKWKGTNTVSGGTNNVDLNDTSTWTGDNIVSDGTNNVALYDTGIWLGNSQSSGTGVNNINLDDTAKWQGTSTVTGGTTAATLAGTSTWFVDGDSSVSSLTLATGTTVDMIHDVNNNPLRQFNTLTMDTLSGNDGTFKLETDLDSAVYGSETTYGDKLVVNNATNGTTYYLQVADESIYTGKEINGDRKLLVATDLSANLNLQLVGKALNQGGLWQVHPPTLFQEGDKWYLGYISKQANPDTKVSLSNPQSVYGLWTRTTDTLRKRLGDLRYNDSEAGLWARYLGGRLETSDYQQRYHGFQVGVDKSKGNSAYGLAFEKMETTDSYTNGNGESGSNSGLLYYTNYSDTGSYLDVVAKYGNITSKYYTSGEYPDHADHDNKGYSLSLGYGKTNKLAKGYFVEPKAQLTYSYISGGEYTTDRNTAINEDGIRSLIGRVGIVAGRKINKDSDYYVKASWLHEFKGDRSATLAAANGEHMYVNDEFGDSWFELGIGGNVRIGRNTHVYGDIEKSFGGEIEKKWQINAGARFEF